MADQDVQNVFYPETHFTNEISPAIIYSLPVLNPEGGNFSLIQLLITHMKDFYCRRVYGEVLTYDLWQPLKRGKKMDELQKFERE